MAEEKNDADGDKDHRQVHLSVAVARMDLSSSTTDTPNNEIKIEIGRA